MSEFIMFLAINVVITLALPTIIVICSIGYER